MLLLAGALEQMQVNQPLVGNACAVRLTLEEVDDEHVQVHCDGSARLLGTWVRSRIRQVVLSFQLLCNNT